MSRSYPTLHSLELQEYGRQLRAKNAYGDSVNHYRPYLIKIVTLYCHWQKYRYAVPQHFVKQAPVLAASLNQPHILPYLWINKADEYIDHTIVNWLYTGLFETLRPPTTQGTAKRQKEY